MNKDNTATATATAPTVERRRIVVCLDGTWDTPKEKTNVWRIYNNLLDMSQKDNSIQVSGYFPGVGTNNYFVLLGGMFGVGVGHQIKRAYTFICENYQDDSNDICVFGFSRGAFAARALVGMIYNVGLLPKEKLLEIDGAYSFYLSQSKDTSPSSEKAIKFRRDHQCRRPIIYFLGCFDTVGALGVPKLPWYLGGSALYSIGQDLHGFHDTHLPPIVKTACHALCIHEQREWFKPTMMNYSKTYNPQQTIEQVWFPGMHGDVGGQQTDSSDDSLLSCHSFHWMMAKAKIHGLKFKPSSEVIGDCKHQSFLYQDSYKNLLVYKIMPRTDRVIPKDDFSNRFDAAIQLYRKGDFLSYLTVQDLDKYKSKTLQVFYENCIKQDQKN